MLALSFLQLLCCTNESGAQEEKIFLGVPSLVHGVVWINHPIPSTAPEGDLAQGIEGL